MSLAQSLNADSREGRLNLAALQAELLAQGEGWQHLVAERCPHLFAEVAVFVDAARMHQMADVIGAVERAVNSEKWSEGSACDSLSPGRTYGGGSRGTGEKGVFYGYDFHVDRDGVHLIEINTNAGGAFLNAKLAVSQPGAAAADFDREFLGMFEAEWRLSGGDGRLSCIAIVDENPEQQYLYPEFLLAQQLFERAGISAHIADPGALTVKEDGLYLGPERIDLVYNRLTDFTLKTCPALLGAWRDGRVALTPNPDHHARYADKRNLARLTDEALLRDIGVHYADIAVLLAGIPHTFEVTPAQGESLWEMRRNLFFKPVDGYGSRGAYRGDKLTRRVFGEILHSAYVAQQLFPPDERCVNDAIRLKYDIRCYVYDGKIQLVAARLYQGQTTNFRTEGGGFAQVRLVG